MCNRHLVMRGFGKSQQVIFLGVALVVLLADFVRQPHWPSINCSTAELRPRQLTAKLLSATTNIRTRFVLGFPIDVNRARMEDLALIPGINQGLARRIVEFRQSRGAYKTWHDLRRVKGVGPAKIQRFRSYLSF